MCEWCALNVVFIGGEGGSIVSMEHNIKRMVLSLLDIVVSCPLCCQVEWVKVLGLHLLVKARLLSIIRHVLYFKD